MSERWHLRVAHERPHEYMHSFQTRWGGKGAPWVRLAAAVRVDTPSGTVYARVHGTLRYSANVPRPYCRAKVSMSVGPHVIR